MGKDARSTAVHTVYDRNDSKQENSTRALGSDGSASRKTELTCTYVCSFLKLN